jgi:S-adenosylmethionine hydrolase
VEVVHLDRPQYWLPEVSHVFHGRDIFAPAAGHLAAGVPLHELGTAIHDPVRLQLPQPERTAEGCRGQVIYTDHFGNLTTNIRREQLGEPAPGVRVRLRGIEIRGLARTFGEQPTGELVALYGSSGDLIISVVNGSAALQAEVGDAVEVII